MNTALFDLHVTDVTHGTHGAGTRWVTFANGSAMLWIDAETRTRIVAEHARELELERAPRPRPGCVAQRGITPTKEGMR